MKTDFLLKNASLIHKDGSIEEHRSLLIRKGKIQGVFPADGGEQRNDGEGLDQSASQCIDKGFDGEIVDCTGRYISPGFVNLHTHSGMNVFRGIAEDVHIEDWFNREIFPYESHMTAAHVRAGAYGAVLEMLENGVTAFADHYFFAEEICDVVAETGIRGDIAPTLFGMAPDFDAQLESVSHLIESRNGKTENLRLRMGPHAPYTCPGETLKRIIHRAKELQVGIHLHVSETERQVAESRAAQGKTPFQVLGEAGGFELPGIIAHGLWIEAEDRKLLGPETFMAVSPKTYMKLSMGFGHLWENSFELPLCTGTDGAASSNTLNPLEQAQLFCLIGKALGGDATAFTIKEGWRMLMMGHEALNFKTGELKEGCPADLLVWDLSSARTAPVKDPLVAILYSANSGNIIHTMVNGRFLKKNGVLCPNLKKGILDVKGALEDLINTGKGKTAIVF